MADAPAFDPSKPFDSLDVASSTAPEFDPSKPFEEAPAAMSTADTAADIAKSGGIGLVKGAIGLAGLPGDMRDLTANLASKASKSLGYEISPEAVSHVLKFMPFPNAAGLTSQQLTGQLESAIGSDLYEPKSAPGRYAETAGEFMPAVIGGPESLGAKLATRVVAPALVGQTAAEATRGTSLEPYAKGAGALVGGLGAAGMASAVRDAVSPQSNVAADLARAIGRDGENPDALWQRLLQTRQVRPDATLADVGGENVRGLVERVAQTPGAGRATVVPSLTQRQQGQLARVANDLTGLTGTRQTAVQATQETMAARAQAATPLYRQAYDDGDQAIWSPGLERLSSSPTVQAAMRGAVRVWRDNAIADGYGAMNPGAMVQNGQLSFLPSNLPALPNLQFWDYTKRLIDDQVGGALRNGQNQKARTLTTLARSLRGELDTQVPSYTAARQAWGGPSQYLESIQDGGSILQRTLSAEQLRANLGEMTDAQREGYLVGAVSSIMQKMRSDPAKLGDMTKYLRSPEMRDKITALMPTPEAANSWQQRLDYEVRSSELTGRALGNSTTARRLAEKQDADSIAGDLVMSALSHRPTLGLLRHSLMAVPSRVRDSLRSRSDALLADVLTQPTANLLPALRGAAAQPTSSALPAITSGAAYSDPLRLTVNPPPQHFAHGGSVNHKVSKDTAHYRAGNQKQRCAICTMFRRPNDCTAVKGWIMPKGLCDYFERVPVTRAHGGRAFDDGGGITIDRRYDVPYLAGSSNDSKTVYIDRRVPRKIAVKRANGKGRISIDPAEFLAAHEEAEHRAMNAGKSYEKAHIEDGTKAERDLVKKRALDWDNYEEVMDGLLSHIEHEKPKHPPKGLYLKPYPHDKKLLLKRNSA